MKNWIGKSFHVKDGDYYLTAYFIDPMNVCSKSTKRDKKYVGNQLSIQIGNHKDGSPKAMKIPLREEDMEGTDWVEGKCVWGMGKFGFSFRYF